MATAVDGTHPTGMHSCLAKILQYNRLVRPLRIWRPSLWEILDPTLNSHLLACFQFVPPSQASVCSQWGGGR